MNNNELYNLKSNRPDESFWRNGLSIDETKMSTLIICLLLCMLFAGFNYTVNGDITYNLTSVIQALIYAIAGVNITNSIINNANMFNRNNNYQNQNMQNETIKNQSDVIPPGITSQPNRENVRNTHK